MPIAIREGQAIVFLFIVCQPSFVSYLLFFILKTYLENLISGFSQKDSMFFTLFFSHEFSCSFLSSSVGVFMFDF